MTTILIDYMIEIFPKPECSKLRLEQSLVRLISWMVSSQLRLPFIKTTWVEVPALAPSPSTPRDPSLLIV